MPVQHRYEFSELGHRLVDVALLRIEEGDAIRALLDRHFALGVPAIVDIIEVDHLAHVGEAESDALAAQDPGQPRTIAMTVYPGEALPAWGYEALILVETQSPGCNPELGAHLRNRELFAVILRRDLHPGDRHRIRSCLHC